MAKQVLSGKILREKLLSGIKLLADTVTITLGPLGKNVGISNTWVNNIILHDGISVAKNIDEVSDMFESFGINIVRQSAEKTNTVSGDGTTTATLLASELIKSGFKHIDEDNANPMIMKKGMEEALQKILAYIETKSKPIKTKEEIQQVATISSADTEMGQIIGEVVHKIGKDGVVSVEEYEGLQLSVNYKEGMSFSKGYISHLFADENGTANVESPYILITDNILSSPDEIAKFLKAFVAETNRAEIVIICRDMLGGALSTLLINKARSNIVPLSIFAPFIGDRQKQVLEDIAVLTGGTVIFKDGTVKLEDVKADMLGRADRVITTLEETKIIGGFGTKENIEKRVQQLRKDIENTTSEFEKEKLQERLAHLVSGSAIIKVGAKTEIELSDKKERVIDAVAATKAAVADGIIAGGGITLFNANKSLVGQYNDSSKDKQMGYEIVMSAIVEPIIKLLDNAGVETEKVLAKINSSKEEDFGYNLVTEEYGNMYKMGIIDPVLVVKESLQNAVSVASAILTCEAVICNIPEEKTT